MNPLHKHVIKSKAKGSKYNQPKNATNFAKPLIHQEIIEVNKINNKKK